MTQRSNQETNSTDSKKKAYERPKLERMNEKAPVVNGAPPVPGAPAAAQASPVAPGASVF